MEESSKGRVSYPEPATKRYDGSPYETWCRQRLRPKVVVRSRGQGCATIIWDALPLESRIYDGWPDEEDRKELGELITSAMGCEYAIIGGIFVGYVDLANCSFRQVAGLAEQIAGFLDERFGVRRAA